MLLRQGVFTLKGLLLSLSVFLRVVDNASCFHLHSFPDFLLTQPTSAIIQQHHLRLWHSEPLSAPTPVSQLRSEIRLPSPFLGNSTLFMCFQMLCGWADTTHRYLDRSGSHQPRKMNRLPVTPAPPELCVCACFCHASVSALQVHSPGPTHAVTAFGYTGRILSVPQHFWSFLISLPLIIHTYAFEKRLETPLQICRQKWYILLRWMKLEPNIPCGVSLHWKNSNMCMFWGNGLASLFTLSSQCWTSHGQHWAVPSTSSTTKFLSSAIDSTSLTPSLLQTPTCTLG